MVLPYFSVSLPRTAAPVIDLDDETFRYPWPTGKARLPSRGCCSWPRRSSSWTRPPRTSAQVRGGTAAGLEGSPLRPRFLRHRDQILVIDDGQEVQRGRHAGLLTSVGRYGGLHDNQYARHANPPRMARGPPRTATRARSLLEYEDDLVPLTAFKAVPKSYERPRRVWHRAAAYCLDG